MKPNSHGHGVPVPQAERQIWDQFRNDHELLERLRVTPDELEALSECVLLGTLTCKQDMLFILRQIRMATDPESEETKGSPEPAQRREDKAADSAKEFSAIGSRRQATVRNITEPSTLAGIARSRAIEQFGVLFSALLLISFLMWNFVAGLSTWRQHFLAKTGLHTHQPTASEWHSSRSRR
jgi:hypothetical protein